MDKAVEWPLWSGNHQMNNRAVSVNPATQGEYRGNPNRGVRRDCTRGNLDRPVRSVQPIGTEAEDTVRTAPMEKVQSQAEMTWPLTPPTDLQIAWLAGLFEGEGCMSIAKNGGTRLTIRMTDRDVIERVNALLPGTKIQVVTPKPAKAYTNQPKTQYAWRISNPDQVRKILTMLLPHFGERRAAKAIEVLMHLDSRVGMGGHQRAKTHCPQRHLYSPENTYVNPTTGVRHCRTCRAGWDRAARSRVG